MGCGLDENSEFEPISVEKVENPSDIDKEIPTITFKCCNEVYALSQNLDNYLAVERQHFDEHPECYA